jgi:toxin CptA
VDVPGHIGLRRSHLLSWLLVLLHILSAGSLFLAPWPAVARYSLLALVVLSAWHTLQPSTIVGLRLGENGELWFLSPGGDFVPVRVQPDSAVFSWLIVLRVWEVDQGRLRSLALLRDSMPAEQFRLLRVWLRWRANPGDHAADGV